MGRGASEIEFRVCLIAAAHNFDVSCALVASVRMVFGCVLVLVVFGALSVDASGATVEGERVSRSDGRGSVPVLRIAFAAMPGEVNDLEVQADPSARAWRLSDRGALLEASGDCAGLNPHVVVCVLPAGVTVAEFAVALGDQGDSADVPPVTALPAAGGIDGGDGDDVARAGAPFSLSGGDGNDVLAAMFLNGGAGGDELTIVGGRAGAADGGPGNDRVVGGSGNDSLDGGGGLDTVVGGGGDDLIQDGDATFEGVRAVDRDRLDGGAGYDKVTWRWHPAPIDLDLAATGPAGQAPRTDDVTGFEAAFGGLRGDRLRGDAGRNELFGGDGNDRLFGGDGRDWLLGGSGRDRLEGGTGDDYLFGDGGPDRLAGGDGADTLRSAADFFVDRIVCGRDDHGTADRPDRVRGGCPDVKPVPGQLLENYATRRGGRIRIHFSCLDRYPDCNGVTRVRARIGARWVRIGKPRFTCPGEAPCEDAARTPHVALPSTVRAELRRRGRVTLELLIVLRPGRRAGVIPIRDHISLR